MRFWIVGGGTGGHVYPALAAVQALRTIEPDAELTWVGTEDGMESALVKAQAIPFVSIPAGGVHGVGVTKMVRNAARLVQGFWSAWQRMRQARPDALLTTGGYVSVPTALAAWLRRVPIVVFLPDIEPAQSVRLVGMLARRIAATVEDSRAYLSPRKLATTGYPLRQELLDWERAAARAHLGLDADLPTLLVFGGSRGARSINRALLAALPALTEVAQVLHISGTLDWPDVAAARAGLPSAVQARYHACEYLHAMGAALAAADLVVSRAGASILGEFPYYGLPAILAPYPHAWRYQKVNAQWLAERGAALVIEDAALAESLAPTVLGLLADAERRQAMAQAARALARPDAAQQLAGLLLTVAREGRGA